MIKRILSLFLVIAHLLAFGGMREALAFSAASASYNLSPGAWMQAGSGRLSASFKLPQDSIGESIIGRMQSAGFRLEAGYVPSIRSNPPTQSQIIPNQNWSQNQSKADAFDLDDYFSSPDGLVLNYSASGNFAISVVIEPTTNMVSFSQSAGWTGTEKVKFTAIDSDYNSLTSNEITLQVEAGDNPPVLDFIPDINADEGDEVVITPHATDLDGDEISFGFSAPFDAEGRWQTDHEDAGIYTVTVTATDATGLEATQQVRINIRNVNRPPALSALADVAVQEGELVTIAPEAADPDGDATLFYFSSPLDSAGKWLTGYDDAGVYPFTVTASDGVDTVVQEGQIIVNNVNRPPEISLSLSQQTVDIGVDILIQLTGIDPDGDATTFVLKKDGQEVAAGDLSETYEKSVSFATAGDHTISVVVTDSGGLSAENFAGVDVIDPNASTNLIFPIMGDFNGDALCDLGLYNGATGIWEVALSQGGVFTNAVDWLQAGATTADVSPVGGDFNGDGKADVGLYDKSSGELRVALSGGSSFSSPMLWLDLDVNGESWFAFSGNFNGDKYSDFGVYNKDTGEVRVALGSGTGLSGLSAWISGFDSGYSALAGDFNGDSLADICLVDKATGEYKVVFSNGRAFVDGAVWISGFGAGREPVVSDYNNDGISDIGYWDKTELKWHYAVSTGDSFSDKGEWRDFGSSGDEFVTTGDFNGDGIMDVAGYDHELSGILRWKTQLSVQKAPDLLIQIDNGFGGRTQAVYSYASLADNSSLPFPVRVASNISMIDTLPAGEPQETYTQQFIFSDGYYDASEREFRGFGKVKSIDPLTGNYTETYFYQGKPGQDGALKGQIEKIIAYDGNARQISQTTNTYRVRKAGPAENVLGFPALVAQDTTVWEENSSSLSTRSEFAYDNIGNVLQVVNQGDLAKTGDEKETQTSYAQAYETGFCRPLETFLKDKDDNIILKKTFEYDAKGNLSKEVVFIFDPINSTTQQTQSFYGYDSFGNLTSATDALGHTVTTEYETGFYAYPQRVTNTLGHFVTYAYDPRFGVVTSVTDPNGNTTSSSYDSLGRILASTNAYGETTVSRAYPDFNTKITLSGGLAKTEYADGLGRIYKAVSNGEDGEEARQVSSEVYYNNRGLVEKESVAHYADEDSANISYIKYEYDIRGRVKKTVSDFPGSLKDAESQINYISPLYVETLDPMGHKKGALKDVYGNVMEVTEFTSGGVYKTHYEYDIQNNLAKVTDSKGNATQMWYDSLGRKLKMDDPDMGVWTYEYDLIGNLVRQTDAKGQVLEFQYDELNRLTGKLANGQTIVTYAYDDPGSSGSGGDTVMVDSYSSTQNSSLGNTLSWTHNVNAHPDRILVVLVGAEEASSIENMAVFGITWEIPGSSPQSLTKTRGFTFADYGRAELWYLSLPKEGAGTIMVTYSGDCANRIAGAVSIYNAQQSGPAGSGMDYLTNTDNVFLDLTAAHDGSLAVGYVHAGDVNDIEAGNSAVERFEVDCDSSTGSVLTQETNAGTFTLSVNSSSFVNRLGIVAAVFSPAAGASEPKENYIGRLSRVTDQSGSTEFFYDKLGRKIKSVKTVDGAPFTVTREYDILDRLTKLTYPDGEGVNYSYDTNSGLLEKVFSVNGTLSTVNYVTNVTYDAQGRMRRIQYGNGVTTQYNYGQDLRLSQILTSISALTLQNLNYIFDKNGNITTLTDNLRSNIRTYAYDELDRLIRAQNVPAPSGGYVDYYYQYDSIGNMTYKSDVGVMSYGSGAGPHALTSAGGYSYSYDANGNMVSGKNKSLSYDVENRLSIVVSGPATANYVYDGDGGLVKQTTANGQQTTATTYIGSLYEVESDGIIKKHIYAGSNKVCSVDHGSSTVDYRYFHTDHLGSSSVITGVDGNEVAHYEYTPYGGISRNEGKDVTRYKFTGKQLFDTIGLYHYGARFYDPEIGRFITADTIVQAPYDPQSLNRYSYCRNNPLNYVDPTGHWFWLAIAAIVGASLGGVSAAISGQSIGFGILLGALGGALVAGGAFAAASVWGPAWAFAGASAGGALSGAANAGVFGGNVGIGALTGALGAGLGAGIGYGVGNAFGNFWGALTGGVGGGFLGGGIGAELSGGDFWQGAGQGAAYGAVGGLAGYGVAKTFSPKVNQRSEQKAPKQLQITHKGDPKLEQGYIRRYVGRDEYWNIYDSEKVMSNRGNTYFTPNDLGTSSAEYMPALQLNNPRFGFVDIPYKNFDYCLKQTTVQRVPAGYAQEIIMQQGIAVSVRGGRLVRFDTMDQKTFIYSNE